MTLVLDPLALRRLACGRRIVLVRAVAAALSAAPGAARLVRDMLDGHAQAMDSIEPDAARALWLLARVVAASQFQSCGSQRLAEIGLCVYDDEG
jgi:hypothetical protein